MRKIFETGKLQLNYRILQGAETREELQLAKCNSLKGAPGFQTVTRGWRERSGGATGLNFF